MAVVGSISLLLRAELGDFEFKTEAAKRMLRGLHGEARRVSRGMEGMSFGGDALAKGLKALVSPRGLAGAGIAGAAIYATIRTVKNLADELEKVNVLAETGAIRASAKWLYFGSAIAASIPLVGTLAESFVQVADEITGAATALRSFEAAQKDMAAWNAQWAKTRAAVDAVHSIHGELLSDVELLTAADKEQTRIIQERNRELERVAVARRRLEEAAIAPGAKETEKYRRDIALLDEAVKLVWEKYDITTGLLARERERTADALHWNTIADEAILKLDEMLAIYEAERDFQQEISDEWDAMIDDSQRRAERIADSVRTPYERVKEELEEIEELVKGGFLDITIAERKARELTRSLERVREPGRIQFAAAVPAGGRFDLSEAYRMQAMTQAPTLDIEKKQLDELTKVSPLLKGILDNTRGGGLAN